MIHTSARHNAVCAAAILAATSVLTGCRGDSLVIPAQTETVGEIIDNGPVEGFYLLNEGNMGSNKCTLDYYDYRTGTYSRNIYAERNPNVVKELGDVGNDLGIYRGRLYAVINCSHKVEVTDASTAVRIGQIDIPNCRHIIFNDGKAYVSSYVGPVQISGDAPKGAVYEIDTATLRITRRVTVGYQPEEMAIIDGRLYVANSGGYRAPDYDHTVSVIDLAKFRQTRLIQTAINLDRLRTDRYGKIWLTSRGDHGEISSCIQTLEADDAGEYHVSTTLPYPCSQLAIKGDSLIYISAQWSDLTQTNAISYGIIDVRTGKKLTDNFITDGTEADIMMPYGLAVHPITGDIFLTDAKNYVSSGTLRCYSRFGKLKWSVRTGDIPASIAFLTDENRQPDPQ